MATCRKILENKQMLTDYNFTTKDQIILKDLINRAIVDFKKALEIDPNYTDAYRNLQTAYNVRQLLNQ